MGTKREFSIFALLFICSTCVNGRVVSSTPNLLVGTQDGSLVISTTLQPSTESPTTELPLEDEVVTTTEGTINDLATPDEDVNGLVKSSAKV